MSAVEKLIERWKEAHARRRAAPEFEKRYAERTYALGQSLKNIRHRVRCDLRDEDWK